MIIAILRAVVFFTKRRGYRTITGMSILFAEKTIEGRLKDVSCRNRQGLHSLVPRLIADGYDIRTVEGLLDHRAVAWIVRQVRPPDCCADRHPWFCTLRGSM